MLNVFFCVFTGHLHFFRELSLQQFACLLVFNFFLDHCIFWALIPCEMNNWQRVFSVLQAVPSPRPLFSCWAKDFISCNLTYLLLFPELFRKLLPMIISWRAPFMFSSRRFKFSSHPRKLLIHSVIFFHRAWWFKWAMFPQRPRCLNIFFPGAGSVWGRFRGCGLAGGSLPWGWALGVHSLTLFPVCSLLFLCCWRHLSFLLLSLRLPHAPVAPHRDGVLSLWKCNPK